MRNTFIILVITLSSFNLISQDSIKKIKLGVDFSVGNNALGRRNILPSITLTSKKHSVFIGPAFIFGMEYNPYPPAYGFQAGYQFYPNGNKNRFNLFFEYDFNYVKTNFNFHYSGSYPSSMKTQNIEVSSIDNYLGFGFRLNICKWLYLKTNVGIGAIYYGEKIKATFYDGREENYEYWGGFVIGNFYPFGATNGGYYYYYGWNNKHFTGIFKFGLGCDIYSFKRKK